MDADFRADESGRAGDEEFFHGVDAEMTECRVSSDQWKRREV